jgi:hypothetical protein
MNGDNVHELSAAYALDALDADDLRAFEEHLGACEGCRDDVTSFRATAAALAYDVDLPPLPETLEHRILDAARAERPKVVPLRQRVALPATALGAVAAAAAIALGIWATQLSNSLDKERAKSKSQTSVIDILSDCKRIPTVVGNGSVCVAPTRKAVLTADDLAAASPGKTYEAWVISGKRVEPAGLFRGGAGRKYLRLTRPVPNGAIVGVTLEKAGGVKSPTTTRMLLRAEVKAS